MASRDWVADCNQLNTPHHILPINLWMAFSRASVWFLDLSLFSSFSLWPHTCISHDIPISISCTLHYCVLNVVMLTRQTKTENVMNIIPVKLTHVCAVTLFTWVSSLTEPRAWTLCLKSGNLELALAECNLWNCSKFALQQFLLVRSQKNHRVQGVFNSLILYLFENQNIKVTQILVI